MIKHLIIIPFLFTLISCKEIQTFEDKNGGCVDGKCTNKPSEKPQACRSASTLTTFVGYNFASPIEKGSDGTEFHAEVYFANNNAAFTQYCENENGFASPSVESGYKWSPKFKKLQFTDPGIKEQTYGAKICKAQLSGQIFKVNFEGLCLVLEDSKGEKTYFQRK